MLHPNNLEPVSTYPGFWPPRLTPMFLTVSGIHNKIFGYSLSNEDSKVTILRNFKNPSRSQVSHQSIPSSETWAGMELSTNGEYVITLIQTSEDYTNQYMKLAAFDHRRNPTKLENYCERPFQSHTFSTVQFMRKVKGYDYFVVACFNSLAIFGFTGSDFVLINLIEKIQKEMIFEVAIFNDYMVMATTGERENVKVIQFGVEKQRGTVMSNVLNNSQGGASPDRRGVAEALPQKPKGDSFAGSVFDRYVVNVINAPPKSKFSFRKKLRKKKHNFSIFL